MSELGAAQADLNAQCVDLGFQSLAECLDATIPAKARQPGDLDPVQPPPEPVAVPEEPMAEAPVEPTGPGMMDVALEDIAPVLDSAKEEPAAPEQYQQQLLEWRDPDRICHLCG